MVPRQFKLLGLIISTFFIIISFSEALAKQPIAFSHKLHTVQNGIPCQYCHLYARRSFSSGVPPVSTCIGCHGPQEQKLVKPDSSEVKKLREYWSNGMPIPWVKVHDIPDFV